MPSLINIRGGHGCGRFTNEEKKMVCNDVLWINQLFRRPTAGSKASLWMSFISYLLYHIPYHISYQIFYHISYQVSHHIIYNNRYHIITYIIIYTILFNMCVDICYEDQRYLRWPEPWLMTISFSTRGRSSRTAPNCQSSQQDFTEFPNTCTCCGILLFPLINVIKF